MGRLSRYSAFAVAVGLAFSSGCRKVEPSLDAKVAGATIDFGIEPWENTVKLYDFAMEFNEEANYDTAEITLDSAIKSLAKCDLKDTPFHAQLTAELAVTYLDHSLRHRTNKDKRSQACQILATSYLNEALRIDDENKVVLYAIGRFAYITQQFDDALFYFKSARKKSIVSPKKDDRLDKRNKSLNKDIQMFIKQIEQIQEEQRLIEFERNAA